MFRNLIGNIINKTFTLFIPTTYIMVVILVEGDAVINKIIIQNKVPVLICMCVSFTYVKQLNPGMNIYR